MILQYYKIISEKKVRIYEPPILQNYFRDQTP